MSNMRLAVTGAGGRMGRMLIRAIAEAEGMSVSAALERPDSPHLGEDAGVLAGVGPLDIPVTSDALQAFVTTDGVLDFSTPAATVAFADLAAQARIVHVIGTTGLEPEHLNRIKAASWHAPIVRSGNMSLGVNLLAGLVQRVAAALGEEADIEVLEMHHRMKVDAPSGTALLLGEAAAAGRGVALAAKSVRARDGHTGARRPGDIGFATLRGGSVVGDHTVIFGATGERLELTHRAEDRGIFARGALRAARWAWGRKPGLYDMQDVLGFSAPHDEA